jgi:hypothetical protein
VRRVAFVDMSNVLNEAKKQQVIAWVRLGWPLRIEQETGVRRETVGAYLKADGIGVRPPSAWGRRSFCIQFAPLFGVQLNANQKMTPYRPASLLKGRVLDRLFHVVVVPPEPEVSPFGLRIVPVALALIHAQEDVPAVI